MDNPVNGNDASGYASIGAIIATIFAGAWAVLKGRLSGEVDAAISRTRVDITDALVKESQQSREAVFALRELLTSERDILLALKDAVFRLVPIQENIAQMMKEQRESERAMEQQANLLRLIAERDAEKEREFGRQRDRDHNRGARD